MSSGRAVSFPLISYHYGIVIVYHLVLLFNSPPNINSTILKHLIYWPHSREIESYCHNSLHISSFFFKKIDAVFIIYEKTDSHSNSEQNLDLWLYDIAS